MIQRHAPGERAQQIFRIVAVAALVAAFAQVTLGGIVRVTGSGLGCPDWPLCHGRIIPPLETATLIEYSHRLSASVLGVLVLAAAAMAWLFYRSNRWVLISSLLGLATVVVAGALGGATVLTELAWWVRLFHLGAAEMVVACMVIVLVVGWRPAQRLAAQGPAVRESDRFNLLVLATGLGVLALILSGSYMVGSGAGASCATWPLCRGSLFPDGTPYAVHMGHRLLAAFVGLLIITTAASAWRRRVQRPEVGWAGLIVATLFAVQVIAGAGTVWAGFSSQMKAVHLSMASLSWMALVFLAALIYPPQRFGFRGAEARRGQVSGLERLTP